MFKLNVAAWSVVTSGLLAAVLVTAALYLVGAGGLLHSSRASRRVTSDLHGGYYGGWHGAGHQDRWGRRQEQPGPDSLDTLLALLSVDSIQVSIQIIGCCINPDYQRSRKWNLDWKIN